MSGYGKSTKKYRARGYNDYTDEEMSFEFTGSSDIGTFELKVTDSIYNGGKTFEDKVHFNIEQLTIIYQFLKEFDEAYGLPEVSIEE